MCTKNYWVYGWKTQTKSTNWIQMYSRVTPSENTFTKKVGAYDVDSARRCWQIKKTKNLWFVLVFECYSFSSILNYRKMGIFFTPMHFVSSEYDSEKGNTTHFIRKLTNLVWFLKNLVDSGSSLHEFETCYGCVFH